MTSAETLDLEQFIDDQLDVDAIAGFSVPSYDDFSADLLASFPQALLPDHPSPADTGSGGSSSLDAAVPLPGSLLLPDSFTGDSYPHHQPLSSSTSSAASTDVDNFSSSAPAPKLEPEPAAIRLTPDSNTNSNSHHAEGALLVAPSALRDLQGRNADLAAENAALRKRLGAVARENRAMRAEFARVAPHVPLPSAEQLQAPKTSPNSKVAAASAAADRPDWVEGVKRAVTVGSSSPKKRKARRISQGSASPPGSPTSSAAATTTALCVFCLLGIFASPALFASSEEEQIRLVQLPAHPSSSLSATDATGGSFDAPESTSVDFYRGIRGAHPSASRLAHPGAHQRMYHAKMAFLRSLRDAPEAPRAADSYLMSLDAVSLVNTKTSCPLGAVTDQPPPASQQGNVPTPYRLAMDGGVDDSRCVHTMTFVVPAKALGENRSQDDMSVLEISCNVVNVTRHSSPWPASSKVTAEIALTS